MASTYARPAVAPKDKVVALQKALRASGATDRKGLLPVVDGIFGPSTLEAVNAWNVRSGGTASPALSREQVIAGIDRLTQAIMARNVPTGAKRPPAPTALISQPLQTSKEPVGTANIGPFACRADLCKPTRPEAKALAIALQKALNQLPAAARKNFPNRGAQIPLTGNLGPQTLQAYQATVMASAQRRNVAPDPDLMARGVGWLAQNLDVALIVVTQELAARSESPRVATPRLPPKVASAQPDAIGFQMTRAGTASGTPAWRCIAMGLQVQLNRLGQRIQIDGVVGVNTQASVNKVLGQKWTIRDIARELRVVAKLVQEQADAAGAPPPPESAYRLAVEKCQLESSAPLFDARYFTAGAVAVPTPAPTPAPTVAEQQPIPIPPSPKIQALQALLNEFPPPILSLYPDGKPVVVSGLLTENDVAATRAIVRFDLARQGKGEAEIVSAVEALTRTSVSAGIDSVLGGIRRVLPLAQGFYAQPMAPSPAMPQIVTGQSRSGLLYQSTTGGIMGYGPNAGAFTAQVRELQQQINRLLAAEGVGGGALGYFHVNGAVVLGRVVRKKRVRTRTPAGQVQTRVVTTGPGVSVTGILDPPTVDAFNRYVVPKLEVSAAYRAEDIAADIDKAVEVARLAAERAEATRQPMTPMAPAPEVRMSMAPLPPPPSPDEAPAGLSPATADQIVAQAEAQGLDPAEAKTIVASAMQAGQSARQAQAMVDRAVETQPGAEEAEREMARPFPLGAKIAIGVAGALGAGLIGFGVAGMRKARRRARAVA